MKYLPTERDRQLVRTRALAWARRNGLTGQRRNDAATSAELDFWERWRGLDEAAQLATFQDPDTTPSSRGTV